MPACKNIDVKGKASEIVSGALEGIFANIKDKGMEGISTFDIRYDRSQLSAIRDRP